ncbi:MAG: SUMF1/EgtB/PvdO family nonheme iron enzyme [Myxococcales bacterium]|nr:SUMF1/EgtB/PvdO family nonheme iron enzyme [Myxococcales bacterium]
MTLLHERELALVLALALGGCGGSEFSAGDSAGAGGAAGNASGGAAGSATGGAAGTASGGSAGNPSGGAAGSSGGAAGAAGGGGNCPDDMVAFQGQFCIDKHEVTIGQYDGWLNNDPSLQDQPAECSWNADYDRGNSLACLGTANQPVRCVDWCDAYAYCKGQGKRLCGRRGTGASNDYADYKDPQRSEWYAACSNEAQNTFPYGDTYGPNTCNGKDHLLPPGPVGVGTMSGCVGGVIGLFDMSGNVAEWEDSCNAQNGSGDDCRVRGGSYNADESILRCDNGLSSPRNNKPPVIGIRCCK